MSFRVQVAHSVRRKIASWRLPDFLMVEIHLRLSEDLARRGSEALERSSGPFDGMLYRFILIDPANRLTEHFCTFHVLFGQDEESFHVINFNYIRRTG